MAELVLYGFWRSSATWRARIALGLKGLAYAYRPVNLLEGVQHGPEHRARNPLEQVPVLETIEDDGATIRIAQSLVIAEYLDERFAPAVLLPPDRVGRARVRQIAEAINSGIQPLANTSVRLFVHELGADEDAWSRHWIERGLEAVERMLPAAGGPFAFGDAPTLADVCVVPQLYHARRFGIDTAGLPRLSRIERACGGLEAFVETHPERQIDAPPKG